MTHSSKLRATVVAALVGLTLAGGGLAGPVSTAHATKNDGRYAKTVGSRVKAGSLTDSFCGDSLDQYNKANSQADNAIAHWYFADANCWLDTADVWRDNARARGCAWPLAV